MGEITTQDLHRVARWKKLRDIALKLTHDNFVVMREAYAALKEIREDKLWHEGGYVSWLDCSLKAFQMTPRVDGFLGSATRQLESTAIDRRRLPAAELGAKASPTRTASELVLRSQTQFREIGAALTSVQDDIERLATTEYGAAIQTETTAVHLRNAHATMKDAMPAGLCGYCVAPDPCGKCEGRRWLPHSLFKHQPPDLERDLDTGEGDE